MQQGRCGSPRQRQTAPGAAPHRPSHREVGPEGRTPRDKDKPLHDRKLQGGAQRVVIQEGRLYAFPLALP